MNMLVQQQEVSPFPEGGLLQSRQWMDVMRAEDREVLSLDGGAADTVFAIVHRVPLIGDYAYVPRLRMMTPRLARAMAALPFGWVRFDAARDAVWQECATAAGAAIVPAPHDMQPRHNLIMDVTPDADTLLAAMKPKTRYNIRLAAKKGVDVRTTRADSDYRAFYDLVCATARRKGVRFHARRHYGAILTNLPADMVDLYAAFYHGTMIAGGIVARLNATATYVHGASGDAYRDVMAPFAMQWRAITDAKARGCRWYDFGGVFPDTADDGRQGITRFKRGFAPRTPLTATAGSYDMVLSPTRYALYRAAQRLRM